MDNRFLEENIKQLILEKKNVFGDIGENTIIFEKAIMQAKTIADCLIMTENRGVIGVEIKTERDSTKRLNKQLGHYEQVCDYVYVLCHDDHVLKVEQILKRYNHGHVGIMSYTEFRGEPILGIYKKPLRSPRKSAYHMLNILWKGEIIKILGTFRHYGRRVEEAKGVKALNDANRGSNSNRLAATSGYGKKTKKPVLINTLIRKLGGPEEATKVFCDIWIHNRTHPDKSIKYHHFIKKGDEDHS